MRPRRLLSTRKHAVFLLDSGLLLVFKPRGHREEVHAHPHRQRLRVLRGKLVVQVGQRTVALQPASRPLTVGVGCAHATVAVEDCWLLAQALPAAHRKA